MSGSLRLIGTYAWHYRVQTAVLVACLVMTTFLPIAFRLLTHQFQAELFARAEATPLLIGAIGSRYDLTIHSLYFEGKSSADIPIGKLEPIDESKLARTIPLYVRHSARSLPVVGTTIDYFEFRGLKISTGRSLATLGDCVVGHEAARRLDLKPGDRLITDRKNVLEIVGPTPLRMKVAGVLQPTHSTDDRAIFVDLKTAWIIEGIGHGHTDIPSTGSEFLLEESKGKVVANAALPTMIEINEQNIDSFHFHGDPTTFPLTAAIVAPKDPKSAAILAGRFLGPNVNVQLIKPRDIIEEVFSLVLRVKSFFDLQAGLVAGAVLLLMGLIVTISNRLRRREMETLFKIGASSGTMMTLKVGYWFLVAIFAFAIVAVLTTLTLQYASTLLRYLLF